MVCEILWLADFLLNARCQDDTLLPTRTARARICIGDEVATLSRLAWCVLCGACFDWFMSSVLNWMRLSFTSINLFWDCCKHVSMKASTGIISWFWGDPALLFADEACSHWEKLQDPPFLYPFSLSQSREHIALSNKRPSDRLLGKWKYLGVCPVKRGQFFVCLRARYST